MELHVLRLTSDDDSTCGILRVNGRFECFTLEDEHRDDKLMHETRIPAGVYDVQFRTVGGFNHRYSKRYGHEWHQGMLQIKNVPGFDYILFHVGNDDDDTSGCILVGAGCNVNHSGGGTVTSSRVGYERFYPKVRDALLNGESVTLVVQDDDRR